MTDKGLLLIIQTVGHLIVPGVFTTPNRVSQNSGTIDNLGSLTSYASQNPAIPATLDAAASKYYVRM